MSDKSLQITHTHSKRTELRPRPEPFVNTKFICVYEQKWEKSCIRADDDNRTHECEILPTSILTHI